MTDFLLLAFIFLVAGVISVPIASRLGLGSVLGYLLAGIIISPILAGLHVDIHSIQQFAEFGVVMMLFLVGLELEPQRLWEMRGRLLGLGGLQVCGTALAITLAAMALGQPWQTALAIGLVLSLSSTAIVLQTLGEKGLLKSDGGQSSFSVLLFQDVAAIPMLALIPLLSLPALMLTMGGHGEVADAHGGGISLVADLEGWQVGLVNIAAIAAVILGGNYLTRPIFRFISNARLRELFTGTALMIVIGIALLMSLVNLSPALGTFLAGVVLANSEYRHELESDINPFKGLLLGLFFITVGASVNFDLLSGNFLVILALTAALIAIKTAILWLLGVMFKLQGADRWLFALGLAQTGEFAFVLLSFSVANAVIPQQIADLLLLAVAISMMLTPVMFIIYNRVVIPRFAAEEARENDEITEQSDIIIAGHGRVGGIVNRMLRSAGYKTTVIDFSAAQLDMLRKFGFHVYYGDATRPDLLHAAGIARARLLVIAIDDRDQTTELVRYVVKHYPHLHVIARATDRYHVYHLWHAGCRDIIRETYDSSIRMGRSAYEALGAPHEAAVEMAAAFEEVDRSSMVELADLFDPDKPGSENDAYIKRTLELRDEWDKQLLGKAQDLMKKYAPEKE
ncbi:monovalent cation:proton antiporter-2 (CPA2) family protein [Rhizobium sp. L1K21]|uniref:monovalent cation:proton antiporter-2 (CPA2) family protein n=1 Tax=Rhizobium sp. L1K21 TaxID=2954933 RepID=UPI0020929243|nr:monovalent cation:proton antiporter-2 (CPA2) family protein [Rhizobium sp. L1K21]MCO6187661.1 monovalent cation:proton antiporter-2 (CPA2) family protein [Rhizobium sp. L1K21]